MLSYGVLTVLLTGSISSSLLNKSLDSLNFRLPEQKCALIDRLTCVVYLNHIFIYFNNVTKY